MPPAQRLVLVVHLVSSSAGRSDLVSEVGPPLDVHAWFPPAATDVVKASEFVRVRYEESRLLLRFRVIAGPFMPLQA